MNNKNFNGNVVIELLYHLICKTEYSDPIFSQPKNIFERMASKKYGCQRREICVLFNNEFILYCHVKKRYFINFYAINNYYYDENVPKNNIDCIYLEMFYMHNSSMRQNSMKDKQAYDLHIHTNNSWDFRYYFIEYYLKNESNVAFGKKMLKKSRLLLTL